MSAREWASLIGDIWPIVVTVGAIGVFIGKAHLSAMKKLNLAITLQRNALDEITNLKGEIKGLDTRVIKIENRIESNAEATNKTFKKHEATLGEHSRELQDHAHRLNSLEDTRKAG